MLSCMNLRFRAINRRHMLGEGARMGSGRWRDATWAASPGRRGHQASIHACFLPADGEGVGAERRPAMIQRRVSAGSITSSISK